MAFCWVPPLSVFMGWVTPETFIPRRSTMSVATLRSRLDWITLRRLNMRQAGQRDVAGDTHVRDEACGLAVLRQQADAAADRVARRAEVHCSARRR